MRMCSELDLWARSGPTCAQAWIPILIQSEFHVVGCRATLCYAMLRSASRFALRILASRCMFISSSPSPKGLAAQTKRTLVAGVCPSRVEVGLEEAPSYAAALPPAEQIFLFQKKICLGAITLAQDVIAR